MTETKTARVSLRLAEADDALIREAAEVEAKSVNDFFVESGRERAENVLADRREFSIPLDQWEAFLAVLDRPARDIPALRQLWSRPRPE